MGLYLNQQLYLQELSELRLHLLWQLVYLLRMQLNCKARKV